MTDYVAMLTASKNIILRGAPGTGKTYLAKQIAAKLVTNGEKENYDNLTDDEKQRIGFVQFHPSYDYTDFVEGLRPVVNKKDGQMGFELRDGVFKEFCERANFYGAWDEFLKYIKGIEGIEDTKKELYITKECYLEVSEKDSIKLKYDSHGNGGSLTKERMYNHYRGREPHYKSSEADKVIEKMKAKIDLKTTPFVFIIDEINRGEISKIFGELFYSIDPGYRGESGSVLTQYANMTEKPKHFYVPENVYIIGTMNDIDRSVDTFDFAMRRRFRFIEVKAEDTLAMLDQLEDDKAKKRLENLNQAIDKLEVLNRNYHIGPAYFLKLKDIAYDYEALWSDYLAPLLEEYLRGTYDEETKLTELKKAYEGN